MKKWIIQQDPPTEFLAQFPDLPSLAVRLLYHRGLITQKAIDEFLNPDYGSDIHDPLLFRDMRKVVERIERAIDAKEKIVVHGDYDADGVSGAAILFETLKTLGAVVDVFLPHRETEGYGLNMGTVELLAHDGAKLIITCDCGISNAPEVARANELGVDVIITDHHNVPAELPPAFAIIHAKVPGETYPFDELAGGGVAWKVSQALVRSPRARSRIADAEQFLKWQLDCVAIATVADMVPLIGENRTLVTYGLVVLEKTKRKGLRALFDAAGLRRPVDATSIGFAIAPRLNAAGRIEHANAAFALLMVDEPVEAEKLAQDLNATNRERQERTATTMTEARAQVAGSGQEDATAIVVGDEAWSISLAGLVASRLVEAYGRPAFVLSKRDGAWAGSGRSTPGFHLMNELRAITPSPFAKIGGHPGACGFTLNDGVTPEDVAALIRTRSDVVLKGEELVPTLTIDCAVHVTDLSWEAFDVITRFAPFGVGNPAPVYTVMGVRVVERAEMGVQGQHLRLFLQQGSGKQWKALAFGKAKEYADVQAGDTVDCAFTLAIDEWNGNRELMMKIVDVRRVGA